MASMINGRRKVTCTSTVPFQMTVMTRPQVINMLRVGGQRNRRHSGISPHIQNNLTLAIKRQDMDPHVE